MHLGRVLEMAESSTDRETYEGKIAELWDVVADVQRRLRAWTANRSFVGRRRFPL
jgi:hypothetical protein